MLVLKRNEGKEGIKGKLDKDEKRISWHLSKEDL